MDDIEKIAKWIENLHCSLKHNDLCVKTECILFRWLAKHIRSGEWK